MSIFTKIMKATTKQEKIINISSDEFKDFVNKDKANELALYDLALQTAVTIIANALSKCEFRTFLWKEKEQKIVETFGDEYYLWNFQPNQNQNASQFMFELIWTLIYRGECLVVVSPTGGLLIADKYTHIKNAIIPDTFQNVEVSRPHEPGQGSGYTFRETFRSEDVLFYRLNNQNVKTLLDDLTNDYHEMLKTALENFQKQGGERGTLNISSAAPNTKYGTKADGTPRTFTDVYNDMMTKQFADYFKSSNAVMTLWDGFKYEPKQPSRIPSASNLSDVTGITGEIYDRVATALQIPPALLKGNVADVEAMTENFITFSIDPIAKMIERENNRKRYGKRVLNGSKMIIDTSTIKHMDAFSIASSADKMIASGAWSIDDVRRKANDVPLGEEWSRRHYLTKNYGSIDESSNETTTEEVEKGDLGNA